MAKELEFQYSASMTAAQTLLKEAIRFVQSCLANEAMALMPDVRGALNQDLQALKSMEIRLNTVKAQVSAGVERATWGGKFESIRTEVAQIDTEVKDIHERSKQIGQNEEADEIEAAVTDFNTEITAKQKELQDLKLRVVQMLKGLGSGASSAQRKEVTGLLQQVTSNETELKDAGVKAAEAQMRAKYLAADREAEAKVDNAEKVSGELIEVLVGDDAADQWTDEMKEKVTSALSTCAEARKQFTGENWKGKALSADRRKLQGDLMSRVAKTEQELNKSRQNAEKSVELAATRAATQDIRESVEEATGTVAAAVEKAKALDEAGLTAETVPAVRDGVLEAVASAKTIVHETKQKVLTRIQETIAKGTPTPPTQVSALKKALSELVITLNGGSTQLAQVESKANFAVDKVACDAAIAEVKVQVDEATAAAKAVEEKVAAVADDCTDEELCAAHAELETAMTDVKAKAKAALEKCGTALASISAAESKGPKGEMKKSLNALSMQCRSTESKLNKDTMKVRERYGALKFEENLAAVQELITEIESEVKQAIEDSQTLMPEDTEDMDESRVLQIHSLVEDTLSPAKTVIAKAQKIFESCQITVRSGSSTVSQESKQKLSELQKRTLAADRSLKEKTGTVVRKVEDMKARVESKSLEAELAPLEEAASGVAEKANTLDAVEEAEIEKACEAVTKELSELRGKLESISSRCTAAATKSNTPDVKQALAKVRNKSMTTVARLKAPATLVEKAPAAAKLRAQVSHVSKPVVEIEAEAAKALELHKELQAKLKEVIDSGLSEEAAKTVGKQMESLASSAREKVTAVREKITKALEEESGEVKEEVARLQKRVEAIDVKMRSAQTFAATADEKASGSARVHAIKKEAEKLQTQYAELHEKFTPLSSQKLRTEFGMDKVAETIAADGAAIDGLLAAIPPQLEAFSAVATGKFNPPFEVRKKLEELLAKVDQLKTWRVEAVEAVELAACRKALAALKEAQAELKEASLFAKIRGEPSGHMTSAEFAKYWTKADIVAAAKVFEYMNAKGLAEGIPEAEFTALVKDMYTCSNSIALTDQFSISKSKVMRTLEVGEKLEVLEGPNKDEATKVERIRVIAPKDKVTGWVTVQGNQGTVYCEPTSGEKQMLALDQAIMQRRKVAIAAAKLEKDARVKLTATAEQTAAVEKEFVDKLKADTVTVAEAGQLATAAKRAVGAARNGSLKVAQQAVVALKRVSKDGASAREMEEQSEDYSKRLQALQKLASDLPARVKELAAARDKKRSEVVAKLRSAAKTAASAETYAQSLGSDGKVSREALGKAIKALGEELSDDHLGYVFEYFTNDETCTVEDLAAQLRSLYRCVTQVGVQDDISIGKSKIVATLLVGDLVEGLQDPTEDGAAKVMRLKLKTLKDGKTAWGTVRGNQGTTFLEELTGEELRELAASSKPKPMETD
jgi:hypothetical protein